MKFPYSYVGDSSDGEEQEEFENGYIAKQNKYLTHINYGLKKTPYKVSYLLKDIGGRLLHNKEVTKEYLRIKSFTKIGEENAKLQKVVKSLKDSIYEKTKIINDKYILGKFVQGGGLDIIELNKYHQANKKAIKEFVYTIFPKLEEEEKFLSRLKEVHDKYNNTTSPIDFTNDLNNLYQSLIEKWNKPKAFGKYFGIGRANRKEFTQELQSYIFKDTLSQILEDHRAKESRKEIVGDIGEQTKYFLKKVHAKESDSIQFLLTEHALPTLEFFIESDNNNAVEFLAAVRAYHKFTRGIIKNTLLHQDEFKIKSSQIIIKVGTATYQNSTVVSLGNLCIPVGDEVYNTGSMSSEIYGMTGKLKATYSTLKDDIKNFSNRTNLSSCFKGILRGKEQNIEDWKKFSNEEQHYLYDLAFFLFGCEATRNVATLLSNPIFFDLLDIKFYSIDDMVSKLPMAMVNAVPSSVELDKKFETKYGGLNGLLSSVLYYDYRSKVNNPKVSDLCERDNILLVDWLVYYKIGVDKNFLNNIKKLPQSSTIKKLEEILGNDINTNLEDKSKTIKSCGTECYINSNEECKIKLKITLNENTKKVEDAKFEIIKISSTIFHTLIMEWYGIDMPYLKTGNFILKAEAEPKDPNTHKDHDKCVAIMIENEEAVDNNPRGDIQISKIEENNSSLTNKIGLLGENFPIAAAALNNWDIIECY